MVEEEDQILRSGLCGVTAARSEDIERNLLTEVTEHGPFSDAVLGGMGTSDATRSILHSRLKALQTELDVVASIVEEINTSAINEKCVVSTTFSNLQEQKCKESENNTEHKFSRDLLLQHALVFDRLRSLEEAKAVIENELCCLGDEKASSNIQRGSLARYFVREEVRPKKKIGQSKKFDQKHSKQNAVSLADDADFDSALDSASSSFIETEKDKMIRKGILTPFHRLKGFERRVQSQDYSNIQEYDSTESTSIIRTVQSMSKAKNSRPSTKLLDATSLPTIGAPVQPFHMLKDSLVQLPDGEKTWKKTPKKDRRRPLADRKWKELSCKEDTLDKDSGGTSECPSDEELKLGEDINWLEGQEMASVTLEGGLNIPESIFGKLFDYQKVGVQWLWELHCQKAGGIIGDEMGLGKTIQVLCFLGALHFSNLYKPSIIICPVTLLRQWKREAEKWYPRFKVGILHDSAWESSHGKKRVRSDNGGDNLLSSSDIEQNSPCKNAGKWDSLLHKILRSSSGLLITTYEQLRIFSEKLLDIEWGYAVLDEGHRIRNPDADVTILCKQLQTVHRLIMTGAPIQNKLSEIWSLFDFVFPGKLGVLPVFEAEFSVPISVGGYVNASPLQVSTAYRCAVVLRDLIMPYLLRRMKADVDAHLTKKTEHVLFCSLTAEQLSVYRAFLASSEVEQILNGNRNSLYGIDVMRKICNHPDLIEREQALGNPTYGATERSGKMKVVEQVLRNWKDMGHRVLLFTQTQQMLDIIENFLRSQFYSYRRMDGLTPVKQRMTLIDEFNNSDNVFIFILTTKVGGLGTNLTGANRVIIFDPDWNPSTDTQARERAWRIGQTRDVVVYRLITGGTIEEKVYHRQIYKHFLTNKILTNPQQRRFFKSRDLRDLFILNDDVVNGSTETSNIFNQIFEEGAVATCPESVDSGDNKRVSVTAEESSGSGKQKGGNDGDDEETSILKSLFGAQGIHSTIDHDRIMNSHDDGEKAKVEQEAAHVAQRAAEALLHSRLVRSRDSISVPTWTGRFGSAGAPPSLRPKFGSTPNPRPPPGRPLSSAHLLAKLKETRENALLDGLRHQRGPPPLASRNGSGRIQPEVLIRQLCSFIELQGGKATSSSIVNSFKDRVPSAQLPLFKNLLKEIAILQKESGGSSSSSSLWELKPEYSRQHQQKL